MRRRSKIGAVLIAVAMLAGCSGKAGSVASGSKTSKSSSSGSSVSSVSSVPSEPDVSEPEATPAEEPEVDVPKQVVIYFANWRLEDAAAEEGGEVAGLPWDQVTYINHAFWKVVPAEGEAESSFDRRAAGKEARTDFKIISTNEKNDLIDDAPSAIDPSVKRNHFAEYAAMSEKYPDVNVMISLGGWNDCGFFSEMAHTPEGRKSFIDSCIDTMKTYSFIDGIDLDWEYPAGSNDGERLPEGEGDDGCPIWANKALDRNNFTALCKEMREAFDAEFGEGAKKITACASASTGWTLPNQDWVGPEPYLDLINCMTYDMAGNWDGITGHASSHDALAGAYVYFSGKKIPVEKVTVGSPMYSTIFKITEDLNPDRIDRAEIDKEFKVSGDTITQKELAKLEAEAVSGYRIDKDEDGKPVMGEAFDNGGTGWHMGYNVKKEAPYLWNDDPDSEYYKWYISYENELSLAAKLEFIDHYKMGGIIVWEASEDTVGYERIHEMGAGLLGK